MVHKETLRFSTLFLSRVVNSHLSTDEDIAKAIDWCQRNGLSKVYLETYRSNIWADKEVIVHARDAFREAGFVVAGCVTTTNLAAPAMISVNGILQPDKYLACYSDIRNQDLLQEIFQFTASIFDEIIIDDFYCTVCECLTCTAAKGDLPWAEARCDLLMQMSRERVLAPARKVNPDCRITIKFPVWYDHLAGKGYDVKRETALFDAIYTGTETRNPSGIDSNPQYAAYFMMRWLNNAGGDKNLGGWFDFYTSTPEVYVEQARQTILANSPEVMLFHYKALAEEDVPSMDMAALYAELPELFKLAKLIEGKTPRGVLVPKPLGSSDLDTPTTRITTDRYVLGFLGMLGIPVEPVLSLEGTSGPILATQHLLYDDAVKEDFLAAVASGRPAIMTSALVDVLGGDPGMARVLEFDSKMELMTLPADSLNELRNHVLEPLGLRMDGPARVSLHLYDDDLIVLENFNDKSVEISLGLAGGKSAIAVMSIPKSATIDCQSTSGKLRISMAPRSLVVFSVQ